MHRQRRTKTKQPVGKKRRVPMKKVVGKVVDKWSKTFLDNAYKGHVPSMLKVAELQHQNNGFGKIGYNPYQGRRWVEYAAIHSKSKKATEAFRRLIVREERVKDQLTQLQRADLVRGMSVAFTWQDMPPDYDYDNPLVYDRLTSMAAFKSKQPYEPDNVMLLKERKPMHHSAIKHDAVAKGQVTIGFSPSKGLHPFPLSMPQISSRFDMNYAVKAVLDEKIQRRITDPMARPIYEYTMVQNTPIPRFINKAAQSIQLAELMTRPETNVSLDTHITGKTYLKEGATLADLPGVPTPAGVIRPYQDVVDQEHEMMEDMLKGPQVLLFETANRARDEMEKQFWPVFTTSHMEKIRLFRHAYTRTIGEQYNKHHKRLKNFDDVQEHHGQFVGPNPNPVFEELNRRDEAEANGMAPHMMYHDGPDFEPTEDPEFKLDNPRNVNLWGQMAREKNTPFLESAFPYMGMPRPRSFFLTDPLNVAKPWLPTNLEGSDVGEEELPDNPDKQIVHHFFEEHLFKHATPDFHEDLRKEEQQYEMQDKDMEYIDNYIKYDLIPNPHEPLSRAGESFQDPYPESYRQQVRLSSPLNYMREDQYLITVKNLKAENLGNEGWLYNLDAIDVKKQPKVDTSDPRSVAQATDDLAIKYFTMYKAKIMDEIAEKLPFKQKIPRNGKPTAPEPLTEEARFCTCTSRFPWFTKC
eukprot:UN00296